MNNEQRLFETLRKLTPRVETKLRKVISTEQVLWALCIDLNNTIDELCARQWDEVTLISELVKCESIVELPEVLGSLTFECSIVPDGVVHAVLDEFVRHDGEQWFIHKHDADPFPSNPHAHNYEKALKLHLGNGTLYVGREPAGQLSRKVFMAFRAKVRHIALPKLEI
jgi:hypothetical protein